MKFAIFKIGYAVLCLTMILISRSVSAVPSSLSPELLTVDVRMGKLVVDRVDSNNSLGGVSDFTTSKRTNRTESKLHVYSESGRPCLDYIQIAPTGTVQLQMRFGTQISIFGTDTKNRHYYTFSQSDDGILRLESGTLDDERLKEVENREKFIVPFDRQFDPSATVFTAKSVWEMFIFVPESQRGDWERALGTLCRKSAARDLENIFARVLVQVAQNMENGIVEVKTEDVSALLDGLNHDSLAVRNASERKLRELGTVLIFELEQRNWEDFTPEQQLRLKYITNDISFHSDFEREFSVAIRLLDHPVTWWWAMRSEDLSVRIFAWHFFQQMRQERPDDFIAIPDADFLFNPEESSASVREKQLGLLKNCLRL